MRSPARPVSSEKWIACVGRPPPTREKGNIIGRSLHNAAMPIIVDGNNLLHRLPTTSRSRAEVRRLVLETTRHERIAIVVVFDGPPPTGSPSEESLGSVTVVYAGKAVADDVIIGRLPTGRAASQWAVVTDDRGLAERARRRGATVRGLSEWQRRRPPTPKRVTREPKLSSHEVQEWEDFFSSDSGDDE